MRCTDKRTSGNSSTLADLVAEFLEQDESCPRGEMKTFRGLNIRDAISKAALAKDETGNLFSHQWNLEYHPEVPLKAESILMASVTEIFDCKDFEALHALVKSKLQVPFAGELYWYDTAFRIGISMGIFPEKIYLHAGTKDGAIALGIYKGEEVLEMSDLPTELQKMEAHQIEDFLCIKKDVLNRFKLSNSVASELADT